MSQNKGGLQVLNRKSYSPDTPIFRQGDPGNAAYVVQTGKIEIWITEDDQRKVLGTIGAGGIFGEMALIDNSDRMASATAVDDQRKVLGTIGAGGIFGEMALIDNSDRMASATAVEPSVCIIVPERVFKEKMAHRRAAADFLQQHKIHAARQRRQLIRLRGEQPAKYQCHDNSADKLRSNESWRVYRSNSGKRIGETPRDRDRRVGERRR